MLADVFDLEPSVLLFDIGTELITVDAYMLRHDVPYLRAIHEINKLCNEAARLRGAK